MKYKRSLTQTLDTQQMVLYDNDLWKYEIKMYFIKQEKKGPKHQNGRPVVLIVLAQRNPKHF